MAEAKKLTMEELRARTAKATKEAMTFEKSPTFEMGTGMQVVFRVKKVVSGKFKDQSGKPTDLVIASDVRTSEDDKKFVSAELKAYLQAGLDGPRTAAVVKAGGEARVPNFIVKRFKEKGIELHPGYVYWARYIDDVKTPNGTFRRSAVDALGTEYPEA